MKTLVSLMAVAVCASAFARPAEVAPSDYDEVFPATEIRYGTPAKTQKQCEAQVNSVWVTASWVESGLFRDSTVTGSECIRYFPSDNAIGAKTALFWMLGDIWFSDTSNLGTNHPSYGFNTYKKFVARTNTISRSIGAPLVFIARIGTYGSTGNTWEDRHTKHEAAIMDAAVTAVKQALGYERVSVGGQSGGGTLVGYLLTTGRTDLDCVLISSGAVSYRTRMRTSGMTRNQGAGGTDTTGHSLSDVADPITGVGNIKPDPDRRIYMTSDREDFAVSFESQKEFADAVNKTGNRLIQYEVKAKDDNHHFTEPQGFGAAKICMQGELDDMVARQIRGRRVY